jgi:hypothetical protein
MILSKVKGGEGLLVVSVVPSIPFQLPLAKIPDRKTKDPIKVPRLFTDVSLLHIYRRESRDHLLEVLTCSDYGLIPLAISDFP